MADIDADSSEHSVLVVDDTPSNRLLYGMLLSRAGYQVRSAESGPAALDMIQQQIPSLVLLDYMMPTMDGSEVIRRLRQRSSTRQLPVVVLTASVASQDIEAALKAGADDYINRPVDSRILLTRIRSLIRAHADRAAASVAMPERDALRLELEEAQEVQRAQLPQVPVVWDQWHVLGAVLPSGQIAGDVFDIVLTPNGEGVAFLGDVSGHGTASALVAAETRTHLRDLVLERSLPEAFALLNDRMGERQTGKYSCLAAVQTRGHTVRILNAGLPPVLVLRAAGHLEVAGGGLPIGLFAGSTYKATDVSVKRGDRIIMMSDGITEPFGPADDVKASAARLGLDSAGSLTAHPSDELERRLRSQLESPDDDATVLIMERT